MNREDAIYYLKSSGFSDEQIEAVSKGFEYPMWIDAEDKLPEPHQEVLCCDINGKMETGIYSYRDKDFHFSDNDSIEDIVAWMPLPAPYDEEADDE